MLPCDDCTTTYTSAAARVYGVAAVNTAPRGSSVVTYENGVMSIGFAANPNSVSAVSPVAGSWTVKETA